MIFWRNLTQKNIGRKRLLPSFKIGLNNNTDKFFLQLRIFVKVMTAQVELRGTLLIATI